MYIELCKWLDMPVSEIDVLSVDQLYDVEQRIFEFEKNCDEAKKKLKDAILRRCEAAGRQALRAKGKDTGSKTLPATDELYFKFEIPKKVEWDQETMLGIVEDLSQRGVNIRDFVKIVLTIEESKFSSLPEHIKNMFMPARTVKGGDPRAEIIEKKKKV